MDKVVLSKKPVITNDMNNCLISLFSRVEIECALNQMAHLKALGPDGMPPIFFQKFWSDISNDVVRVVLFCLNSSSLISSLNHTFISLIPKVENPEYVIEF